MQIADRFHLHQNLLEALQNALKSVVPADIKIPVDQEQSDKRQPEEKTAEGFKKNDPLVKPDSYKWISFSNDILKQRQKCSVVILKRHFPGIMPATNPFMPSLNANWLNRFKILDYNHTYRLIFEYLETFYNTTRIHSHCDYMSPDNFEKLFTKTQNENLRIAG